ncbi:MAG: response regulator [Vicinamibacterales bacterium]
MRILLVDRAAEGRDRLERTLASLGHEVVVVPTAADAWTRFDAAPPDIVICEWDAPDIDAAALCARLRADARGASTYVILQTATRLNAGLQAKLSGADGLMPNPIDERQLEVRLAFAQKAIERTRAARRAPTPRPVAVARPNAAAPPVLVASRAPDEDALAILVVEDSVVAQRVMASMLRLLGFRFEMAANGHEALEAARARQFSVIFMDCGMPVLDGFAAAAELRRRGWKLPIIALTAQSQPSDRERCIQAGMNDFLAKPASLEAVQGVLNRWYSKYGRHVA